MIPTRMGAMVQHGDQGDIQCESCCSAGGPPGIKHSTDGRVGCCEACRHKRLSTTSTFARTTQM